MKIFSGLKSFFICITVMLLIGGLLSSCGSTRPYIYMQGQFDTASLSQVKITDPLIQKGDLINVIVYSDNPEATKIYNQPVIMSTMASSSSGGSSSGSSTGGGGGGEVVSQGIGGSSPTSPGYLVDENGDIEFQGLGLLHIEGLSKNQLKQLLDSKLKKYLTNPYYSVRFMNNRFTMLGEISKPGVYSIPNDHINLLEAIGVAGEMTFYGRRDNILVIREQNGKREFGRINLLKPEVMASPYFYLQQNDIIIVEQNKKKVDASDQITTRNISIAASIVSTLAILYSIFRK
jgi:polysaccharide biosynthesis/export protein